MSEYLFVYGTLRSAVRHPLHRVLAGHAQFEGAARYPGRLFDVGRYPAVVPDPAAPASVIGELYRLHRPAAVLPVLDRYEGCTEDSEGPAEYRRESQRVLRADGTWVEAWMYLYNRPTEGLRPIVGGDYLRR